MISLTESKCLSVIYVPDRLSTACSLAFHQRGAAYLFDPKYGRQDIPNGRHSLGELVRSVSVRASSVAEVPVRTVAFVLIVFAPAHGGSDSKNRGGSEGCFAARVGLKRLPRPAKPRKKIKNITRERVLFQTKRQSSILHINIFRVVQFFPCSLFPFKIIKPRTKCANASLNYVAFFRFRLPRDWHAGSWTSKERHTRDNVARARRYEFSEKRNRRAERERMRLLRVGSREYEPSRIARSGFPCSRPSARPSGCGSSRASAIRDYRPSRRAFRCEFFIDLQYTFFIARTSGVLNFKHKHSFGSSSFFPGTENARALKKNRMVFGFLRGPKAGRCWIRRSPGPGFSRTKLVWLRKRSTGADIWEKKIRKWTKIKRRTVPACKSLTGSQGWKTSTTQWVSQCQSNACNPRFRWSECKRVAQSERKSKLSSQD